MSAKVIFCGRLVTDMPNDSANVTDREAAILWGFGRSNARDRRPQLLRPQLVRRNGPSSPLSPHPQRLGPFVLSGEQFVTCFHDAADVTNREDCCGAAPRSFENGK
jgi:hypothetical protein